MRSRRPRQEPNGLQRARLARREKVYPEKMRERETSQGGRGIHRATRTGTRNIHLAKYANAYHMTQVFAGYRLTDTYPTLESNTQVSGDEQASENFSRYHAEIRF